MKIRNLAILGGLMVAAGMATIACSGDDDDDTNPPVTDGGADAAVKLDAAADTGTGAVVPSHALVLLFVQNVVNKQFSMDPILLSYFGPNTQAGHSPSLPDVEECLAFQFGGVIGNGDQLAGAVTTSGYACRSDMSTIHAPLYIPGPIFGQFIAGILAEGMVEGFTFTNAQQAEVLGLEPQIIDADASADGGILAFGWQNTGDAGTGDAGDGGDADAGNP